MSEFIKRLEAPTKENKYYYKDNIFYNSGYGLPNCTCYAWGRWYELLGSKPKLCINNASDWYYYPDGYLRVDVPSKGDIACFINDTNGIGHVAVVEDDVVVGVGTDVSCSQTNGFSILPKFT